jgi:IPT/TIG domain
VRTRVALLSLLCSASAFGAGPPIVSSWFEPNVVRADKPLAPLRVFIRSSGEFPNYRVACGSGTKVMMTKGSGNEYSATIKASDALLGYPIKPGVNANFFGFIEILDAAGKPIDAKYQLVIHVFDSNLPIVSITDIPAKRVRATRRVVNIAVGRTLERFTPDSVTRRFYAHFGGDHYDFLNIVHSNPSWVDDRKHHTVQVDAKGIGKEGQANQIALYGSAGKLLGCNEFPLSTYFDAGGDGMTHELGHQWINSLKNVPGVSHWPLSTMARGMMGFSLAGSNAGGTFPFDFASDGKGGWMMVNKPALDTFVDLDLYLMGLLPPEKVGNHLVVNDPKQQPCVCPIPGGVKTLTIVQVIAANGQRVPSATSSKKTFRVGTVVLSQNGLLSDEEMLLLDYFAGRGEATSKVAVYKGWEESPFAYATKGLGHLGMSLVWPAALPRITSVAPTTFAKAAQTITVNGSGFTSDAKVSLKSPAATFPTPLQTKFVSSAQLTATMAPFSGSAAVIVTQASGQVKLISAVAAAN